VPTITHEAPVELLRQNPMLAVALLRGIPGLSIPRQVRATLVATDLSAVVPAQFLADLVIVVAGEPGGEPLLAVIVESQLTADHDKRYSWPAYVTNVRKANKCDAVLLVICPDAATAKWCREKIRTGHPGFDLEPVVVEPSSIPDLDDLETGSAGVELTVLAAVMGKLDLAEETVQHRILDTLHGVALETRRSYMTLILNVAGEAARNALEAMMTTASYGNDFFEGFVEQGRAQGRALGLAEGLAEGHAEGLAEGHAEGLVEGHAEGLAEGHAEGLAEGRAEGLAEGHAEGRAEGMRDGLLAIFESRGLTLTPRQREHVMSCSEIGRLKEWHTRALTAATADEIFRA
jgi:hypothetical protein